MTCYEYGFLTKCAQQGLSETDVAMLMDFLRNQKAEAEKKDAQNKAMRASNRAKRVRSAKIMLTTLLGGTGAALGAIAGGAIAGKPDKSALRTGAIVGGLGGALGGWNLGKSVGNRAADKQEELEDRTGQSIALQNVGREARRAGNLAAWSLFAPRLTTSGSLIL